MRHAELLAAIVDDIEDSARSAGPLRRQVRALATASIGTAAASDLTEPLRGLVEKVARHAYKVTAVDVAAVRAAGYSERELYELVVVAAEAAARVRLERAFAALPDEGSTS